MKAIFYSPTLRAGGAEKQCALIASELRRAFGCETLVVLNFGTQLKKEYADYLQRAGSEILVLPPNPLARIYRLYRLLRMNRDAVLFNYLTYPDFVGGLVAKMAGVRKIVAGIETDRMYGYKFLLEYIAYRFFSTITICNSFKAQDFFVQRGFRKAKTIVMPSAVEKIPCCTEGSHIGYGTVKIITVGRFVKEKDYETWLNVVARLIKDGLSLQATIIGYGELENQIRNQITILGLAPFVSIIPGRDANVPQALGEHDIYLSTSIQEGTSNSILEAMNAGLPIVATDVGDNAHMVQHERNGFIAPVKDVAALSMYVGRLIGSKELRIEFGVQSQKRIEEEYSLEQICNAYIELIRG